MNKLDNRLKQTIPRKTTEKTTTKTQPPKLAQEETGNPNRPVTSKEIQ